MRLGIWRPVAGPTPVFALAGISTDIINFKLGRCFQYIRQLGFMGRPFFAFFPLDPVLDGLPGRYHGYLAWVIVIGPGLTRYVAGSIHGILAEIFNQIVGLFGGIILEMPLD